MTTVQQEQVLWHSGNEMSEALHISIDRPTTAAITMDDELMANVNQAPEALEVKIHPRSDGEPWTVGIEALEEALRRARVRLVRS